MNSYLTYFFLLFLASVCLSVPSAAALSLFFVSASSSSSDDGDSARDLALDDLHFLVADIRQSSPGDDEAVS